MDDTPDEKLAATRRGFLVAAGGIGLGAAGSLIAGSRAQAQSQAWLQPGNNNHVIGLQEAGGFADGPVGIDFYGHCALKITSPGGTSVLFDPWRDDPSGAWGMWFRQEFPQIPVDITLSTHAHFDHDAIHRPHSTMVLDRMVGRYAFADVTITGFADKHVCRAPGWYSWTDAVAEFGGQACPPDNVGHLDNVVYLIETGGIRTLIWGDNRHDPADGFWDAIGRVDVLTMPVDGSEHILSAAQANAIVERLRPKVVIPTHYLSEQVSYTLTTLQTADAWVASQSSHRLLDSPSLTLAAAEIAAMDREFLYFGHQAHTA